MDRKQEAKREKRKTERAKEKRYSRLSFAD